MDCIENTWAIWTWTWWKAPYSLNLRCEWEWLIEPLIYNWSGITHQSFCFANKIPWTCPCRKCTWYVRDKNWLETPVEDFEVCKPWCPQQEECNWNPICEECLQDPESCIDIPPIWPWPNEVIVECNTWLVYHRSGIDFSRFSLANRIPWDCPYRQCSWIVINNNWNIISTWSFQVPGTWCDPGWGWGWWGDWTWEIPIIPIDIDDIDSPIIPAECISCPCNYADFANSLNINDKIKAILLDDTINTIYSQTVPVFLKEFLE